MPVGVRDKSQIRRRTEHHYTARSVRASSDAMKLLLGFEEVTAGTNLRNDQGRTHLHLASQGSRQHTVVQCLLTGGATVATCEQRGPPNLETRHDVESNNENGWRLYSC